MSSVTYIKIVLAAFFFSSLSFFCVILFSPPSSIDIAYVPGKGREGNSGFQGTGNDRMRAKRKDQDPTEGI